MKKIIKSRLFAFILGAVIFGSIGIVSAYTILAKDVGYTPKDTTWKVTNVKDAIDDLYKKANSGGYTIEEYFSGSVTKLGSVTDWYTEDISIPSGIKEVIIYAHTISDYGRPDINVTGNIIDSNDKNIKYTLQGGGNYASGMYIFTIKTNGKEGNLNVKSTIEAKYPNNTFHHNATLIVLYK